jgi:hypothetical protein
MAGINYIKPGVKRNKDTLSRRVGPGESYIPLPEGSYIKKEKAVRIEGTTAYEKFLITK